MTPPQILSTPTSNSSRPLLGIDPGYHRIGWAVGYRTKQQMRVEACGLITTDPIAQFLERLEALQARFADILAQWQPYAAGIEQVYFSRNTSTALQVATARGILIAELLRTHIKVIELSPQAIKLAATGDGHADKLAMKKMIGLLVKGTPAQLIDDTIDAVACLLAIPNL